MTREEALLKALEALHRIALGVRAMKRVESGDLPANEVLRKSFLDRAMTDSQIERLALDVWEDCVAHVEPQLPGTTIFECSPGDGEPR